ncbi:proteasome core particle subunit beta 4 [Sugiyamaella lignohabitans]|uniref:Proteasome subunit beta n=1 Tax=Sugiyamaella lignohabitans TaxID=796027 RepID=A0A167D5W4_9ASCO|nr:proteasome core particle subunit beta 4 [Sugiyamaella lignohabitans]ANB12522.1 proteasome core particle subunit beta 4 [Sugiyamaella lignohabitans]
MDILIGITTKDSVLIATSKSVARGVSVIKTNDDKTRELTDHSLLAFSGESGDTTNFAEYIQANIRLYGTRNGFEMSNKAIASFTRNELASALRSRKPYQVNILIGGYDVKKKKATLNWIDYLAANVELPYAAHGYAQYYVLSLLDRHHDPNMTQEQGLELLKDCIKELRLRMPIDFKGVQVKVVDEAGVRKLPEDF